MTRFYNKFLAAASAMMLTLTGCVNEDSPCPGDGDEATKVTLQFTVMTHNPAASRDAQQSRATGNPEQGSLLSRAGDDCYDDLQGSPAENYINTADCQFLLFDADRKLLRPIFPEITGKDDVQYTYYTIKASITEPYFDEAVKADLDQIDFYIMVIANSHSTDLDGQYPGFTPGVTTIDDIAAQRVTFNQPVGYHLGGPGGEYRPWTPSIDENRLIPMAGLQKFTVSATQLKESTYDVPVYLSDENANGKTIDMLRAMAKIEVIDRIDVTGTFDPASNANRFHVDKVELFGWYNSGTIMPYINNGNWSTAAGEWSMDSSGDVSLPTISPKSGYNFPVTGAQQKTDNFGRPIYNDDGTPLMDDVKGPEITFSEDDDATALRADKCIVWSGYVVEYSKALVGVMDHEYERYPFIEVTVSNPNSGGMDDSPIFKMKLADYSNGQVVGDGIDFLLRNHIYRYEITGVNSEANIIEVGYTVCDWDNRTVDIPTFN